MSYHQTAKQMSLMLVKNKSQNLPICRTIILPGDLRCAVWDIYICKISQKLPQASSHSLGSALLPSDVEDYFTESHITATVRHKAQTERLCNTNAKKWNNKIK